jgi:hypothetical protein
MLMRCQTFILKFCSAAFCCAFFETWSELFTKDYSALFFSGGLGGGCHGMAVYGDPAHGDPGAFGFIVPPVDCNKQPQLPATPASPARNFTICNGTAGNHMLAIHNGSAVRWCGDASSDERADAYKFWGVEFSDYPGSNHEKYQLCQPKLAACEPIPYLSGYVCALFIVWHTVWTLWAHYHKPESGASIGTMFGCFFKRVAKGGKLVAGSKAWMVTEVYCHLTWFIYALYMCSLLFGMVQGMLHQWSFLYTLVILVFFMPPVMTMAQSCTSFYMYFLYFVPVSCDGGGD